MLCTLKIRACGFAAVSYSGVRGVPSLSYLSLHSIWMLIIMLRALPLSQVGNAAMVDLHATPVCGLVTQTYSTY